jgi:hypothetical protein
MLVSVPTQIGCAALAGFVFAESVGVAVAYGAGVAAAGGGALLASMRRLVRRRTAAADG